MPSTSEVVAALYGASRLLRFDAAGMGYFDLSVDGFWRSFFAAVPTAPLYAILVALELGRRPEAVNVGWTVVVWTLAYGVGWAAFPLAAVPLTRLLRVTDRYVALIVAYNWASVPQTLIILVAALLEASGVMPGGLGTITMLGATLFVLVYHWFIARTALDVGGLTAAGVVLLMLIIGDLVHVGANRLT
jgi:hypothetical protein